MTKLTSDDYLAHISHESARFRDAMASADPAARVATCPEWSAADLLWHLTEVQHFWEHVIRTRPAPPDHYREPDRPRDHATLLSAFDEAHSAFLATLSAAAPSDPAWSWSAEQSVGFSYRRQAHEALIHRLDAELVAGAVTPVSPMLAADGIDEVLAVMYGGAPAWGTFVPAEELVRVDCTDIDRRVWVRLGRFTGTDPEGRERDQEDLRVVADPGTEPDVLVSGGSADLDAWLWRRRDSAGINVSGDRATYERFRSCIDQPID